MAWTAPASWSVGEVVTASKMSTHVKDNLRYLKGLDGAVAIEDDWSTTGTATAATINGTSDVQINGNSIKNKYVYTEGSDYNLTTSSAEITGMSTALDKDGYWLLTFNADFVVADTNDNGIWVESTFAVVSGGTFGAVRTVGGSYMVSGDYCSISFSHVYLVSSNPVNITVKSHKKGGLTGATVLDDPKIIAIWLTE